MKISISKYCILVLMAVMAICVNAQSRPDMGQGQQQTTKKKSVVVAPSTAWTLSDPLGLQYPSTIDTLFENYHVTAIPSLRSKAWATTGNYGCEGQDQIFFDRQQGSEFFFEDALSTWLNSPTKQRFYNTRIPMTLMSHVTGGDKYSNQDRTTIEFSGNATKKLQIGASLDYIYSKGSYDYQAQKNFMWNFFTSYMGDRYEMHAAFQNYNHTNKENGGIKDDLYITDPAQIQGGESKINAKDIPTNLTNAFSVLEGHQFYMNHRYKVGYYHYIRDAKTDTIVGRTYIPVTSFIWTFDYKNSFHKFLNKSASEDATFFPNTYLNATGTDEFNRFYHIRNTLGISMLEGFNKWAKFGFAAYAQHEIRRYTQVVVADSLKSLGAPKGIDTDYRHTENLFWVGGQLTKQHGSILRYNASAQFGILGAVSGDIDINGDITTRIPLLGDTASVRGYGYFKNLEPNYMYKHYVSNHYIWNNENLSKETRFRVGGEINFPYTRTKINVGYETLKNYLYFDTLASPRQYSEPLHVLSLTVNQKLHYKMLHWDNELTFQTSSEDTVLSLPKFAIYSNLYIKFTVAKVLHAQIGVDCNYYTSYYAPAYNPATMSFRNQQKVKCGNFAFMNVYADFKMKQARFFIAYTHVNKGTFGKAYFASPHYPLNPARFQFGVSVNFVN